MNNMMLDVRALGCDGDSPLFAIECIFFPLCEIWQRLTSPHLESL